MIPRLISGRLRQDLRAFPAVGLPGPRQMGKSTRARAIAQDLRGQAADYIDLENPADLARLEDAAAYLRSRRDRLVVIDEVQRAPGLFQILRGVIDETIQAGRETGQFLLLGSASIDLLRQSSESLAGRISCL